MDTNFQVGDIVKSLSGHDKNHLFLVVSIDNFGFLDIIDGRYRKIDSPKRKNPKHIEKVAHDENLISRLQPHQTNLKDSAVQSGRNKLPVLTNAELYRLINLYDKIEI